MSRLKLTWRQISQFRGVMENNGVGQPRDVVSYLESTERLSARSLADLEIPEAIDMGELSRAPAKTDPRVSSFRPIYPPGDPRAKVERARKEALADPQTRATLEALKDDSKAA